MYCCIYLGLPIWVSVSDNKCSLYYQTRLYSPLQNLFLPSFVTTSSINTVVVIPILFCKCFLNAFTRKPFFFLTKNCRSKSVPRDQLFFVEERLGLGNAHPEFNYRLFLSNTKLYSERGKWHSGRLNEGSITLTGGQISLSSSRVDFPFPI